MQGYLRRPGIPVERDTPHLQGGLSGMPSTPTKLKVIITYPPKGSRRIDECDCLTGTDAILVIAHGRTRFILGTGILPRLTPHKVNHTGPSLLWTGRSCYTYYMSQHLEWTVATLSGGSTHQVCLKHTRACGHFHCDPLLRKKTRADKCHDQML